MKKKYIFLLVVTLLLTGCSSSGNTFNSNLTTFNRQLVNIDISEINVDSVTVSKSNDSYIFVANIFLDNETVFETVLTDQTLLSVFTEYKVVLSFGESYIDTFIESNIWKELSLKSYLVNYSITYIVNQIELSDIEIYELDKVIDLEQSNIDIKLSFYGIADELFYTYNTSAGNS